MKRRFFLYVLVPFVLVMFTGCAIVIQKGRRSDLDKIDSLENELNELKHTRGLLEDKLSKEISSNDVNVSMSNRGLVITFVAEVLFDSGRAQLKNSALGTLDKVSSILKEEVPNNRISVEGHTDNVPIAKSRWASNWELSAHRALSVVEHLQKEGINPEKLSASGYGEYQPVTSNDTPDGRKKNRRVEIIIVPNEVKKVDRSAASTGAQTEELK
jgi:chemotaxis protein MotB